MLVPDGDLLDTSNQRTFLGEATAQGRCIAFRPFASPRGSLLNSSQRRANRYSPQTVARAPTTESTAIIQKSIDSMHLLLSLAVGYIQIVTHGGLACNCVVASHTKRASLLLAPGQSGWPDAGFHGAGKCTLMAF